jgi:hypothetical protein
MKRHIHPVCNVSPDARQIKVTRYFRSIASVCVSVTHGLNSHESAREDKVPEWFVQISVSQLVGLKQKLFRVKQRSA